MNNEEDKICHYSGLPSVATYKRDYNFSDVIEFPISCFRCGIEIEIEVDSVEGLSTHEKCCSGCMKQISVTFEIQDGVILSLEVFDPNEEND